MDEDSDPPAVDDPGPEPSGPRGPDPGRPPLADRALSEPFARLRYRDTSLTIWQQQQQQQTAPPSTYLMRSRSAWYSSYGNQAVLVRDHRGLEDRGDQAGRSRICSVM